MNGANSNKGLSSRVRRAAWALGRTIYHAEDVVVLTVDLGAAHKRSATMSREGCDLGLVPIADDTLPTLVAIRPDAESLHRAYLAANYSGYIAYNNSSAIGYLWQFDGRQHDRVERYGIRLGEKDIYMFSYYIAPAYRGRQRGLHFLREVMHVLAEDGYRRAYGFVARDNVAAAWIYAVLGWQPVARRRNRHLLKALMIAPDGIFLHRRVRGLLVRCRSDGPSDFIPLWRRQAVL